VYCIFVASTNFDSLYRFGFVIIYNRLKYLFGPNFRQVFSNKS